MALWSPQISYHYHYSYKGGVQSVEKPAQAHSRINTRIQVHIKRRVAEDRHCTGGKKKTVIAPLGLRLGLFTRTISGGQTEHAVTQPRTYFRTMEKPRLTMQRQWQRRIGPDCGMQQGISPKEQGPPKTPKKQKIPGAPKPQGVTRSRRALFRFLHLGASRVTTTVSKCFMPIFVASRPTPG